ncbi:hypothetical protein [Streptomyces uncialis]|uniref:hypothetical protein n=1 Tax=Streptomyces uncialis TaxID=1048205 RepID=UPI0033C4682B
MRTARLLSAAALAVTTVALAAAPAWGGDAKGTRLFPSSASPGDLVTMNTGGCGAGGTAAGDASSVGAGTFTLAPSSHMGQSVGQFKVPSSAHPGTYEIAVSCADGKQATADLWVGLAGAALPTHPKGHVNTGVGGALGPDPVQTAAGVAALAVAAAGGTWLLHRRARGDGI